MHPGLAPNPLMARYNEAAPAPAPMLGLEHIIRALLGAPNPGIHGFGPGGAVGIPGGPVRAPQQPMAPNQFLENILHGFQGQPQNTLQLHSEGAPPTSGGFSEPVHNGNPLAPLLHPEHAPQGGGFHEPLHNALALLLHHISALKAGAHSNPMQPLSPAPLPTAAHPATAI